MTTKGGPEGGSSSEPLELDGWELLAQWGDVAGLDLTPKKPEPVELTLIQRLLKDQPRQDPTTIVNGITERIDFEQQGPGLIVGHDPIGLVRKLPEGRLERYLEKLILERKNAIKSESANYGIANILGVRAVVYAMHFEHMRGSLGVVAGELFQKAADHAAKDDLPLIGLFASGGVRQQENFAGLVQMERITEAVRMYKSKSDQPYIAVVAGAWGGISASAVPNADLVVGMAGTDYGFSGPRVIQTYEGNPVPEGAQSVENNVIDRNIDVMVQDVDELVMYLGGLLKVSKNPSSKQQLKVDTLPTLRIVGRPGQSRTVDFGPNGIAPAITSRQVIIDSLEVPPAPATDEDLPEDERLMKLYESFIRSPARIDTDFVIQNVFSDVTNLYNHYIDGNRKIYPAIIAAIGKIGAQPFLIIGNQPSYVRTPDGRLQKIPATPGPEDFDYDQRMLEMGARLKLPVIRPADTLGARPTMASEKRGQSRAIAKTIMAVNTYPNPVLSLVLSALGSGGGLATAANGDYRAMMEHSMAYVAEPRSATSILYRKAFPETEETSLTLNTMSATAADQLKMKLIDKEIIPESDDPYQTVKNIHDALATAFIKIQGKRRLRRSRSRRLRNLKGISIKELT